MKRAFFWTAFGIALLATSADSRSAETRFVPTDSGPLTQTAQRRFVFATGVDHPRKVGTVEKTIGALLLHPDGPKEYSNGALCLLAFDASGAIDQAFGNLGAVFFPVKGTQGVSATNILRDQSDRLIVVGWRHEDNGVHAAIAMRFTASGTIDPRFGNGGTVMRISMMRSSPSLLRRLWTIRIAC
jgi:hypothetical protein